MYYLDVVKDPDGLKIDTIGPFFKEEDAKNARLLQRWLLEKDERISLVQSDDPPVLEHIPENFTVVAHILNSESEETQVSLEALESTVQNVLYFAQDHKNAIALKEGEAVLYNDVAADMTAFTLCFPWPSKNILDNDIKDIAQAREDLKKVAKNIFEDLYKKVDKSSKVALEANFNSMKYKGI